MIVALLAMLLGGVGAGTATVAQQLGQQPDAQPTEATPRSTGPASGQATTTMSPSQPVTPQRKPSTSKKPQTSQPRPSTRSTKPTPSTSFTPPARVSERPSAQPSTPTSAVQAVVNLVNQERAKAGCPAVRVDQRLNRAASKHSADMAARGYFAHETPEGRDFVDRATAEGYPNPGAENIAQGYRSAAEVVEGWMSSEGHRANILNCELRTVGVGLAKDGWLWTQVFGF